MQPQHNNEMKIRKDEKQMRERTRGDNIACRMGEETGKIPTALLYILFNPTLSFPLFMNMIVSIPVGKK